MNKLEVPSIDVQLELPKQVTAGESIHIQLTIINRSHSSISLTTPLYNAALNLLVFDELWNLILPQGIGKVHVAFDRIELAPNARFTFNIENLSYISGTSQMSFNLKTGQYYVLAVYHPGTARLPSESTYPIIAVSNVAKLDIE